MDVPLETIQKLHMKNAISMHKVYKEVNNRFILRDLNLEVPQGCIYGLLGPSGCGKTTVLNCIMGLVKINYGKIFVYKNKLSDVGLMPQEIALTMLLTISETFNYYGQLFGMTRAEIERKKYELLKLLQLPPDYSRIDSISGGEQRRVSFAVALLHDPELLFLDEPTVGLDPLISQNIWEYLIKNSTELNKTIIITTHYIEEAKQANKIGLMRKGHILVEGSPFELMQSNNANNLETAFLILCENANNINKEQHNRLPDTQMTPVQSPFRKRRELSINRLKAQTYKNVLFITKEVKVLIFVFSTAILCSIIRNILWGSDLNGIALAIVNNEAENCSEYYQRGCYLERPMSCRFLQHLQNTSAFINLIHKDNLEEATKSVSHNDIWGLLYFAPNFSTSFMNRVLFADITANNMTNESLEVGTIQAQLDSTNKIISDNLKRTLTSEYLNFIKNLFIDCSWSEGVAAPPVKIEEPVYGKREPAFKESQTASFVLLIFFYTALVSSLAYSESENATGANYRSIASGMTTIETNLPILILQSAVTFLQVLVVFYIEFWVFKNPLEGSLLLILLMTFFTILNGISYGFMINAISNSVTFTMLCAASTLSGQVMINGALWPVESMHPILATVVRWAPVYHPLSSFQGMIMRGWNFLHPKVYVGVAVINIWTIAFLIFAYVINSVKTK